MRLGGEAVGPAIVGIGVADLGDDGGGRDGAPARARSRTGEQRRADGNGAQVPDAEHDLPLPVTRNGHSAHAGRGQSRVNGYRPSDGWMA